jgi:hypothetical protein
MKDWYTIASNCKTYEEITAAINDLCAEYEDNDPRYGFAHVVLADFNLDDGYITGALTDYEGVAKWIVSHFRDGRENYTDEDLIYEFSYYVESVFATRDFLKGLLLTPVAIREG